MEDEASSQPDSSGSRASACTLAKALLKEVPLVVEDPLCPCLRPEVVLENVKSPLCPCPGTEEDSAESLDPFPWIWHGEICHLDVCHHDVEEIVHVVGEIEIAKPVPMAVDPNPIVEHSSLTDPVLDGVRRYGPQHTAKAGCSSVWPNVASAVCTASSARASCPSWPQQFGEGKARLWNGASAGPGTPP